MSEVGQRASNAELLAQLNEEHALKHKSACLLLLTAADELDEAPQVLTSGWAAILYLYDLR